jgi:hypothetical protein
VHDEADVRLVDAEAERAGRDHDADSARHESVLRLVALARTELAVVERDRRCRRP